MTFESTFIYYFDCALGNWDTEVYTFEDPLTGKENRSLESFGIWFLMVFLLINTVILLNFVVAILGDTFTTY